MLEEIFDDLLRFLFPGVDAELDMQRGFEFLDKELSEMYPMPDKASQTRFVDKLVKVYRQDGIERWMLVHVEVQGKKDPQFSKRMFRYYYRILDRYDRPVTAIAIFKGHDGKKMLDRFEDHCFGTRLVYQYNTLYISDYPDEVLSMSDNPFALVILAAKKAMLSGKMLESELVNQKLLIAKLLFEKGIFDKNKIKVILTFLHNYVQFADSRTNLIFTQQLDKITCKKNTMGIIEQLAEIKANEARAEGEINVRKAEEKKDRLFVENLLNNTDFSLDKIASLAGTSVSFVEKAKGRLNSK